MTARTHAWRLIRIIIRYRLFDVLQQEPLAHTEKPLWLRVLVRIGSSGTPDRDLGPRMRDALIELGPVYIKLGQLLSTRRDIIPPAIADALASLQDNVPPFPGDAALALVAASLDKPLDAVFEHVDRKPLASASIAQVHAARLLTGEDVVIKVRRPDIEQVIDDTLVFLHDLASRLESRFPAARRLRLIEVIRDYDRTIHAELDLAQEARNTATLRANFAHSPLLYVPRPYLSLSSSGVLVLERIHGVPISATRELDAAGVDKALLANRGVETFFKQVFVDNFFHADMHPGNVFVDLADPANPRYIALDCAIIGSLASSDQEYLARNLVAFFNRDYLGVARLHLESGWVPAATDVNAFAAVIERVCEPHFAKPLSEISFGDFLTDLFRTAEQFNMQIQPQLVLLQKTLLYVEGLGRSLYPQLDLWQTAKPFMERWLLAHSGPAALLGRAIANLPAVLDALLNLPVWLPAARERIIALERAQAVQTATLQALQSSLDDRRTSRRRRQAAAIVMVLVGSILLLEPMSTAVTHGGLWQTSAGVAGALSGFALLIRSLT